MKQFYTDTDIVELHRKGVSSLRVSDDVVLTDLAYEKARQLGIQISDDAPPAAPVRPYLSDKKPLPTKPKADSTPSASPTSERPSEKRITLEQRIRAKVAEKLGDQVDPQLLDTIIKRTLKATGMK